MPSDTPVTLKAVAKECSLSVAAVCRALKGTGTIAESTRKRVKEVADRLGYTPNLHASALVSRHTLHLATVETCTVAILTEEEEDGLGEWARLKEFSATLGLAYTIFNTKETNIRTLARILKARGFSGIIMHRIFRPFDLDQLQCSHFALCAAGRQDKDWPFDIIRDSPEDLLRMALYKAKQFGYKRPGIALHMHKEHVIDDLHRLGEAFAFNQIHQPFNPIPPFYEHTPESGQNFDHMKRLCAWFDQYKPDIVIGFNVSYYYILKGYGIQIPGDAAYIALNVHPSDPWEKDFTGFHSSTDDVARTALERMAFLIRHNRYGLPENKVEIVVTPKWLEGKTCPLSII